MRSKASITIMLFLPKTDSAAHCSLLAGIQYALFQIIYYTTQNTNRLPIDWSRATPIIKR